MAQEGHVEMTQAQPDMQSGSEADAIPAEQMKTCEACGKDKPVDTVYACSYCNMNYCLYHLIPTAHYCGGAFGKPMVSRWYGEGT